MQVEDVAAHILRVDKALNTNKPVDDADKRIVISQLYNDYRWGGPAATFLPPEALAALQLHDMTADSRWAKHFINNTRSLGLYRSRVGFYWLLSYDSFKRDHVLVHAGTAGDAMTQFG